MEISQSLIDIKQRIASVYSLLGDRFAQFPRAKETWSSLATGEEFQCRALKQLSENVEIGGDPPALQQLSDSVTLLCAQGSAAELNLEGAYKLSLELSWIQVDLIAFLVDNMEFPHSLEVRNIAAVMSTNLLNLYDMIEKSMTGSALRKPLYRTRVRLIMLNLVFLEFDMRNYLTGILGLSRLLSQEAGAEEGMKQTIEEIYRFCNVARDAMQGLEGIRKRLGADAGS